MEARVVQVVDMAVSLSPAEIVPEVLLGWIAHEPAVERRRVQELGVALVFMWMAFLSASYTPSRGRGYKEDQPPTERKMLGPHCLRAKFLEL